MYWRSFGTRKMLAIMARTRARRYQLGSVNRRLRAMAVERLVTKQDDRMMLPVPVRQAPVSTSTTYTTATEVSDNTTPARIEEVQVHPTTKWHRSNEMVKGTRNERTPMLT